MEQQVPGQEGLFEFLKENYDSISSEPIKLEGIYDTKAMPITELTVQTTYRDIFLIINMLDDYVSILTCGEGQGVLTEYMIKQFKRLSEELSEQIKLDKEKMYKRCKAKRQEDDIGEEAMTLASRKRQGK